MNLVGFFDGELGQGMSARLGLGDVARKIGRGLDRAGIPFDPISYRPVLEGSSGLPVSDTRFGTNIICLNADTIPAFATDVGAGFFAGRYSIGVWFWETSVFRAENLEAFRFVDEVWVASDYVRRAIEAVTPGIPVRVVPLPIEEPADPRSSREDLGLPPGFMFFFTFNWVSGERKNPTAALAAFTRAFSPGEGPILVLKSVNGEQRKPRALAELRDLAGGRADVYILDEHVSPEEANALMATCDCYLSLHRSEGYGLTMAEAISHGKPVIATGYSGNLEFMDDRTGYLVPFRLVPIPDGWWAFSPGAEWAEPDTGAASQLMRQVYEQPAEAHARGLRARDELLRSFSQDRTARFLSDRLDAVERRRDAAATGVGVHVPLLEASELLARGVGSGLDRRGGRRLTHVGRRLLRRALWPLLVEQHRFDAALVDAVIALQRSVDDVAQSLVDRPPDGRRQLTANRVTASSSSSEPEKA